MNKTVKLLTVISIAGALSTGMITAQPVPVNKGGNKTAVEAPVIKENKKADKRDNKLEKKMPCLPMEKACENQNVIIGKVKSVSSNFVTVTNADGKDITVTVTPFTAVIKKAKGEPANDALKALSSISKNDWVFIKTYKTETKNLYASKILIKNFKPQEEANAK